MTKYAHLSASEFLNQINAMSLDNEYVELRRRVNQLADIEDIMATVDDVLQVGEDINGVEALVYYAALMEGVASDEEERANKLAARMQTTRDRVCHLDGLIRDYDVNSDDALDLKEFVLSLIYEFTQVEIQDD